MRLAPDDSYRGLRWFWLGLAIGLLVGFALGVLVGRGVATPLLTGSGAPTPPRATASPMTPASSALSPTVSPVATSTVEPTTTPLATVPSPTSTPTVAVIETASASLTPTPTTTPSPVPTTTMTPSPSPTPTPTRGPLRQTKLGLGVYASGGAVAPDMDTWRPSVILLLDPSIDFAKSVHTAFPKAFIVGRQFAPKQDLDNPAARGAAFADSVAKTAVPLKGVVNAWMSYNEVSGYTTQSDNNYANWNTFQVAFAGRLQGTYAIDAVAGNDGPSAVAPADYAKYFGGAIGASHYFGVHAYPPLGVRSMREPNGEAAMLRYRAIHDALQQAGIKGGPMILTETGLAEGWRGVETEDAVAADFIWLNSELDKDPYVIGQAVFGLFLSDNQQWAKFNVGGTLIEQLVGNYNTCTPEHSCSPG